MIQNLALCVASGVLVLVAIRKLRERSWGYCKNKVQLEGKVVIITGANSGIGYEIAKELAHRKAQVIMACRNMKEAKKAIESINKSIKTKANLVALELDLGSLKSIKKFADEVLNHFPQIQILINNAGVAFPPKKVHRTEEGWEMHFGVNHLGHFYLTNLLVDTLKKSSPSRVVIVSSTLHEQGKIDFDNLNCTNELLLKEQHVEKKGRVNYLYSNSKLANVYFGIELEKRLKDSGVNVYTLCPGWVYTGLFRHSFAWFNYILIAPVAFLFMRSPKQGAQTPIYCATEPSLDNKSGCIYRDCKPYKSKLEFDDGVATRLWDESQKLIDNRLRELKLT